MFSYFNRGLFTRWGTYALVNQFRAQILMIHVILKKKMNVYVAINLKRVGNYCSGIKFDNKKYPVIADDVNTKPDLGAFSTKETN